MENTGGNFTFIAADFGVSGSNDGERTIELKASAELYIHAKNPERVRSEWLRSKTIPISHKPNWNDVRIIRSMLSLTTAALRDDRTTHILFCTESCIPVATLKETVQSILLNEESPWVETMEGERDATAGEANELVYGKRRGMPHWDRSYVDCFDRNSPRCSRFDERSCWDVLRDAIPSEAIYKALPGWCFLSRKHAQSILDLPSHLGGLNVWPAFEQVWAPEEVYFPTALALCGHMEDVLDFGSDITYNNNDDKSGDLLRDHAVVRRAVTHSQWDERAANHRDRAHPLCYDGRFDHELVKEVRSNGCLFLRKLKQSVDVNLWEKIVIHRRKVDAAGFDTKGSDDVRREERKRGRDWENYHNRGRELDRDWRRGERDRGTRNWRGDRQDFDSRRSGYSDNRENDRDCRRKRDRQDYSDYGSSGWKKRHRR